MSCNHPESSRWPVSDMFLCCSCWKKVVLLDTNSGNENMLCWSNRTAERVTIPPFTLNKPQKGLSATADKS